MMAVDDVRLPVDVEQGAVGGPRFKTAVVTLASGKEARNQEWATQKHEYDISYGIDDKTQFDAVLAFFYERRGALRGFRFKDWRDYSSNGFQTIGAGDGSTTAFQLVKLYGSTNAYTRKITRPVVGTLSVKVAGTLKTETVDYDANYATGVVTFRAGHVPTSGQALTASFEFDVPVRFELDDLAQTMVTETAIEIQSIKLVELPE